MQKTIARFAACVLAASVSCLATSAFAQDAKPDDTVVATVAGQPITEGDLKLAADDLNQQFARMPEEQRRAAALSAIIEIRSISTKAEAAGYTDDPKFKQRLEFLRNRALHEAYITKEVADKISDEDVRARYDKEVAATPPQNEVRARHILVKTKEEAEAIIKELEGGADFEKIASEKTQDPSGAATGGDLGYFGPGQMVPEFEKAAFALDVGQITKEPVQTQFGFHIIKVEDKRQQQPPAFEQVKDQFKTVVLRERYTEMAKKLREEVQVEITDPDLKKAFEGGDEAAPAEGEAKPAEGDGAEAPKQ